MLKKLSIAAIAALSLSTGGAIASGDGGGIHDVDFSFEGPFGKFDQMQLQRGLQVYTEVCTACHGMRYVPLRTLADEGGPQLPADQVIAYSAEFDIYDAEKDEDVPRTPADYFPMGGDPTAPDLSLMAKARAGFHGPQGTGINQMFKGMGGPEYIVAVLTGYTGEEKEEAGTTFYENTAFPGGWIAMSPPLYGEDVEYVDGHSNELHHEAEDIAAFLMWAAEPHMMARQKAGFVGVLMLTLLASLLYLTNKKLWAPIKGKKFVG